MAGGGYTFHLNAGAIKTKIGARADAAAHAAANVTKRRLVSNMKANDLIDTGKMIQTVNVQKAPQYAPAHPVYWVVSPQPYTMFQEKGTNGVPPRPGQILRFKPKGSSVFVFARSTRPIRAKHFLLSAAAALRLADFRP